MGDYEILLNDDVKLVRVTAHGDLATSLGYEIVTKARNLAAEAGYSILYDVRDAVVHFTLTDWFYLPRELDVLKSAEAHTVKVALLIPPDKTEDYRFYEDVARNTGLALRIFLDEQEAIAWLK